MNARLLVVSSNPSLALLLSREGFEVEEHRMPADGSWEGAAAKADGLVLDLSDALLTGLALEERDSDAPPVLVLRPGGGLWDDIALPHGAVQVQLPARPDQVVAGVHEMLDARRRSTPVGRGELPAGAASVAAQLPLRPTRASQPDDDPTLSPPTEPPQKVAPMAAESPNGRLSRLESAPRSRRRGRPHAAVRSATPAKEWAALPVPSEPGPPTPTTGPLTTIKGLEPNLNSPLQQAPPESADRWSVAELVRELEPRVAELDSLSAVTSLVLAAVVDATQAEAGALLVADGDVWCVEAGHGLRALEERFQVADGSWLVQQVVRARQALLVTGTDIARQRLSGVPLASWQNLMAAPVADGQGLIVLARADEPFTPAAVKLLLPLDAEAAELFAAAVLLRRLARRLAPHADSHL